jgi:hypothetical protein
VENFTVLYDHLFCLQETTVNFKEEPECLTEADKVEMEEEETSEESPDLTVKINCADKEIKENEGGDKDTGMETKNESKSFVSSKETTLKQGLEDGTVTRESDPPSSDQDRSGLFDKHSISDRSSTKMNEEKRSEEDILIQNDVCSNSDGMVSGLKKTVVCGEEVMECQNATEDFVKVTNDIEKRKRGRPRKPRVGENIKTDKDKDNGTCGMSEFSKIDVNNELENLAQSLSNKEILNRKPNKLAIRHKEKTVNGIEGVVQKQRTQASKILSDISGDMDFEEHCKGSEGLGQETTKEENGSQNTVMESRPSEGKADSNIDVQKLCNEPKSTANSMVAANGSEASHTY